MQNKLIKEIKPLIKQTRALTKEQAALLKKRVDLIINNVDKDTKNIEQLLDQLLDIMQLGLGEKEFWRLLNYYEQISPEKSQAYKRFYEDDFGTEEVQNKLIMLKELNAQKINFIYHSNLIEGIDLPLENYTKNTEERLIKGHSEAFDYMLSHYTEIPGQKHIKAMHRLLTEGILNEEEAGHYRTRNVYITARCADEKQIIIAEGAPPAEVRAKMVELVKRMRSAKSEIAIWNIHNEFEIIHPFADGNGRIGRLLLNWLRLRNGYPLLTIDIEERREYYQRIAEHRKHKRLLFEEQLF